MDRKKLIADAENLLRISICESAGGRLTRLAKAKPDAD